MEEDNKTLFRQQVIDEFNSKLNGDVILNSALNKKLVSVIFLWFLLIFSFFNLVRINESKTISGFFYFDEKNNLSSQILISPEYLTDFYLGKNIEVYVPDLQNRVILEVTSIDKKLLVDESKKIKVKVLAKLLGSKISIKGESFQLNEGIGFTLVIDGKNITLFSWVKEHFSGRVNG